MTRDPLKLKSLSDFSVLDAPDFIGPYNPRVPEKEQMILRMLVCPKYGTLRIPQELSWLSGAIETISEHDKAVTGIADSWCYVTVRHGKVKSTTDDEWHFDGASFRVEHIPERNYIWSSADPTEYKTGKLSIPEDFDPMRHHLFKLAEAQTKDEPIKTIKARCWYRLSPFCLHRRPTINHDGIRTFIRVSFTDIEIRDVNNTQNPLIPTNAYGRDAVKAFRKQLQEYPNG
jgi:hypothetical protein